MMRRIEESARDCHLPMVHGGYYGNGIFHPAILMSENDHGQRKKGEAALGDLLSFALAQGGNGAGPFRQVGIETAKFRSPEDPHVSGLIQGIKKALDPNGIMKPPSSFSGISKGRKMETCE